MDIIKKGMKCQQCGAAVTGDSEKCEYCGTVFYSTDETTKEKKIKTVLKDFGWKGILYLNIIGIIFIYSLGWFFEDKEYWLDDTAIVLWAVILPLWIILMTFFWFRKKGTIIIGFILSLAIFGIHILLIMSFERWHFNDDYAGIAAMFAGIALGAWILGRFFHHLVRVYMVNKK
ncbi:MAG: MFS transporter [bacterium]|nr:MFS transporter [bacterium]